MSDNPNLVNIGTPEQPVFVSKEALKPNTPKGNDEWEMIADGSIDLPGPALDNLLKKIEDENK